MTANATDLKLRPGPAPADSREHAPTLLVVDDNQVLRRQLARSFERRGYHVRTAANFDEATSLANVDSPELAVVDLRMPGRSGLELLQELKRIDPATRVVMLTGFGSIATAVDAMRLGATNFVAKPADADDILAAFARAEQPVLGGATTDYRAPSLDRAKWEHIHRVLSDCGGNISEAARRLGMHRRSLQRKLQKKAPE
ncbi:MAG TPA: response regulator [Pirellulales bacterium]|jgi:two-component system response regulator RegA|nr:response regulator [Pirellulales bacterium]